MDIRSESLDRRRMNRNVTANDAVLAVIRPNVGKEIRVFRKLGLVVIPLDKDLSAMKPSQDHEILFVHSDVAQVIDRIRGLHDRVPTLDHVAVHLMDRGEGTNRRPVIVLETKNSRMAEMGIGDIEAVRAHGLKTPLFLTMFFIIATSLSFSLGC